MVQCVVCSGRGILIKDIFCGLFGMDNNCFSEGVDGGSPSVSMIDGRARRKGALEVAMVIVGTRGARGPGDQSERSRQCLIFVLFPRKRIDYRFCETQ